MTTTETHRQLASFIWEICNLLRGPYKRGDYRKVILPMTVLRRFDCVLAETKTAALEEFDKVKDKPETVINARMTKITEQSFYNSSKLDLKKVLSDPNLADQALSSYINGFSPNVREIFERFKFGEQIIKMQENDLVFQVVQKFSTIDLSLKRVDSMQMGYVFEELIRIGAEQSNDESGDHFTPREVIKLMVYLLLSTEDDLAKDHKVKMIYDPACGTGGMLSEAQKYMYSMNETMSVEVFGQDWNDESWATCRSDMLIKKQDAENILNADSIAKDCFPDKKFDYMLANPPFGVNWSKSEKAVRDEAENLGFDGRYGAGLPRISDGGLIFLQHMISKMRSVEEDGSRIGVVFNGSPLFTGDAGQGESEIRRWIIENDWLEAIVALPDQLFYNTGISTYIWIVTNRKESRRKDKVQFIDARNYWLKMPKSLGDKRKQIGDGEEGRPDHIAEITEIYDNFKDGETRKFIIDQKEKVLPVSFVLNNDELGYNRITVERPLRIKYTIAQDALEKLKTVSAFVNLAKSRKKDPKEKAADEQAGKKRQNELREFAEGIVETLGNIEFKNREKFKKRVKQIATESEFRLSAPELKMLMEAFGERDQEADICKLPNGDPEPDSALRDTEAVPLTEDIQTYFEREVLPHVPDAWIDHGKTKKGYELPVNRKFYVYEPPRKLELIEEELALLEKDIMDMLTPAEI